MVLKVYRFHEACFLTYGPMSMELTDVGIDAIVTLAKQKQEGQHPLTGQRAPPISGGT